MATEEMSSAAPPEPMRAAKTAVRGQAHATNAKTKAATGQGLPPHGSAGADGADRGDADNIATNVPGTAADAVAAATAGTAAADTLEPPASSMAPPATLHA